MKIVGFPVDISRAQDPRLVRYWRVRQTLLQTALDLIQAGDDQPTASAITAMSGVSRDDLLRVFPNLDDLYAAVLDVVIGRTVERSGTADPRAPLPSRIELLVSDRAQLFQEWQPVWLFAHRVGQLSPLVGGRVERLRQMLRDRLVDWFAAELRPLDSMGRAVVLDSLDAAFGLDSWLTLRRQRRLSTPQAARTWRFAAQSVALQSLAASPSAALSANP
ncbi:MAG: TetR/AcrR family transcriptional regulator [Reyranellaceae bacterium]